MNRHPASCACSHIWVAVALLSIAAAHASQSPKAIGSITPVDESRWISIERPFPAFALSIPEAADVPAAYAIRRHAAGSGRKDILEFGEPDGAAPYLHVEIYRPGGEIIRFADPAAEIVASASALGPTEVDLGRKFGPLISILFVHCLERHTTAMPRLCVRIR